MILIKFFSLSYWLKNWVLGETLQICILQIAQNNTSHLNLLIDNWLQNNLNHSWWVSMLIELCFYLQIAENRFLRIVSKICVLQTTQNKISHLKYLIVAQEILWIIFCFILLMKRWPYLKITVGWDFRYILEMGVLQITQIQKVTLNQLWIVANKISNQSFFILW